MEDNQLRSDLRLISGNAFITNRSLFDLSFDQGKFKLNRFESTSSVEKLDLSPWYPKLAWVTSQLLVSGNRLSGNLDLDFDVDIDEILFHGEGINKLKLKAALKEKELTANIAVEDDYVIATSTLAYSWGEDQRKYQLDLNLDRLNLHLLNDELGGGKAVYSGDLNTLFMVGNTFDELQGNLLFKDIQFENQTQVDSFNDFILETSLSDQKRIIRTINSDIIDINIEGEFQLSKLNSLFSNAIAESFPFVTKKKIEDAQDLVYDISVQTARLNAVFPDLVIDKKAIFRGVLSTQDNISKMTLNIPRIAFKGVYTENLAIQLDNQNPLFNTFISVGKLKVIPMRFRNLIPWA